MARRYWLEALWLAFAALNLVAILSVPEFETVPFHFVWVSFTLLYGLRVWGVPTTLGALTGVCATTGVAMGWVVTQGPQGPDELTEVPLMAAMFLAMVWHARRRQAALDAAGRAAEREHEFLRDASHQLKTPLAIAQGYAELVRAAAPSDEVRADVDTLVAELNRLSRVAEGLLLLASSDRDQAVLREQIDFEELIVRAAQRWSTVAPRRWRVDVQAEGLLAGDEKRLDSALDVVLDNAVKATDVDERIVIVGRAAGGTALIEISDAGCGLDGTLQARVFDRFWSHWPDRRKNGGTGLGLAIAKAIVEGHGGTISFESASKRGTKVALALPGFSSFGGPGNGVVRTLHDRVLLD